MSWKLIEIINEKEVKEILIFNFPRSGYQKMYFNSDLSLMILKLNNQRSFIYKSEPINGKADAHIEWKMIR